jgi:hypothetical protein
MDHNMLIHHQWGHGMGHTYAHSGVNTPGPVPGAEAVEVEGHKSDTSRQEVGPSGEDMNGSDNKGSLGDDDMVYPSGSDSDASGEDADEVCILHYLTEEGSNIETLYLFSESVSTKVGDSAAKVWEKLPQYERMKQVDPALPSNKFSKQMSKMLCKHASLLFQLQPGHALLNMHLQQIQKADSPVCPFHHQHDETVMHYSYRPSSAP